MITLFILSIAALLVVGVVAVVVGGIGAAIITLFGDFIVFGLVIWLIVKLFRRRR